MNRLERWIETAPKWQLTIASAAFIMAVLSLGSEELADFLIGLFE